MALPEFLVIGVPKAGTTALHAALARHPQLFLPELKEPKFFLSNAPGSRRAGPGDRQTDQRRIRRRADYEALFDHAPPEVLRGEATPFYLHDRGAHENIASLLPDAKLIAVLRDPLDRAHSNWAHLRAAGLEPIADFPAACAAEERRAAAGWDLFWRYLALSRYGQQLTDLLRRFPSDQVLCLRYWELLYQPAAALDRICTFLGVATGLLDGAPAENVTMQGGESPPQRLARVALRSGARIGYRFPPRVRALGREPLLSVIGRGQQPRPMLSPDQRAELLPQVADDIQRLQRATGQDYSDWLRAGAEHHSPVTGRTLAGVTDP